MSRSSARIRGTKSKYFGDSDSENSKDSDSEPIHEDDTVKLQGNKSRKRKSTSAVTKSEKPKRSKPNNTMGAKKGNNEKAAASKQLDLNNNKPATQTGDSIMSDDSDEDDGEDWEEVDDTDVFDLDNYQPQLPSNLKITMEKPKKEKKQGDWVERYIRQEINRIRKKIQLNAHKSHLLLLIGRIRFLNSLINDTTIRCLIMSILPSKNKPPKGSMEKFTSKIFKWFKEEFDINIDRDQVDSDLYRSIISSFETKSINSLTVLVIILSATFRSLLLPTRLCYFFNPIPIMAQDLLRQNSKKKKPIKDAVKSDLASTSSSSTLDEKFDIENNSNQSRDSSKDWTSNYCWIEIFDQNKKKWDCFGFVDDTFESDPRAIATVPDKEISYIVAIDNEDFVSDVTARYASDWVSYSMKKRRIENDWWTETLGIFSRHNFSVYDEADQKEFEELESQVALPTRLSDFKNHPLFVLQRDILKFQAIYPADAPTLGFFREQPVYSRNCVHLLKGRETWLRSARTVKLGEVPYKVVDSRHKNDDKRGNKSATLDLFGEWQTEPYDPPVAKNGIVPRNSYGNVELFQECMLPVGTVYLKQPGLGRLAVKLNIDAAPAVTGFDCVKNHRVTRPIIEGIVICAEYEEVLLDAWRESQANLREKEKQKREKRIYDNWKRLIKGLIIRQNLKIKYG